MVQITTDVAADLLAVTCNHEIAIIGDVMLDRYFWGSVNRVSPEAPVPVVDIDSESFHLGGAANVARNVASLGASALLCGVVGNDAMGSVLKNLMQESGLRTEGIVVDDERPTTVKTRVIGNNQQIVRLDREVRSDVHTEVVKKIIAVLRTRVHLKAIILEDYNKGLLNETSIALLLQFANEQNLMVFVDPKFKNFFAYQQCFLVKPNRKEAEEATGLLMSTTNAIEQVGKTLLQQLQAQNILLTLGAQGMMLFEADGTISSVPTHAKNVADVSGAGDTTIATLATMAVCGATIKQSAALSNIAAGVVVAEPGIVSITPTSLMNAIAHT